MEFMMPRAAAICNMHGYLKVGGHILDEVNERFIAGAEVPQVGDLAEGGGAWGRSGCGDDSGEGLVGRRESIS